MLPKAQRFSRSDVLTVGRATRTVMFAFGSVKIFSHPAKATVVVSKKVLGSAVQRNVLRRRIYTILHSYINNPRGGGAIVYLNKKATQASFAELKNELTQALGVSR